MRKIFSIVTLLLCSFSLFSQSAFTDSRKHFDYNDPAFEIGMVKVYHNIYFGYETAGIQPQSFPVLDTLADFLYYNPELFIEIGIHIDGLGTSSYNKKMSKEKGQMVYQYLMQKGVPAVRLAVAGYGETMPLAPNMIDDKDNPDGRALNRRMEVKITYLLYPPEKPVKPDFVMADPLLLRALLGEDCKPMSFTIFDVHTIENIVDQNCFEEQSFLSSYKQQKRTYIGYSDKEGNEWAMLIFTYDPESNVTQNPLLDSRKLLNRTKYLFVNVTKKACYQSAPYSGVSSLR